MAKIFLTLADKLAELETILNQLFYYAGENHIVYHVDV